MSKYVATFDYTDNILISLSVTTDGVSIICLRIAIGAPAGIELEFTLIFPLTTEIIKQLLSTTRNKKKKYDKIQYNKK